jgi:hypothetical protein
MAAVLGSLIGMFAIVGGAIWMDSIGCHARWDDSGVVSVSYGPLKGCMVKLPDGRTLPADSLREIDIPKPVQK